MQHLQQDSDPGQLPNFCTFLLVIPLPKQLSSWRRVSAMINFEFTETTLSGIRTQDYFSDFFFFNF